MQRRCFLAKVPLRARASWSMRTYLLLPEVRELLHEGSEGDLLSVLQEMHPTDAGAILSAMEPAEIAKALAVLPPDLERDVFGYMDPDAQEAYVQGVGRPRAQKLLSTMLSDDRAAFLERLEPRIRDQLIPLLPTAAREDLLRRNTYSPTQVGAFLSTDYAVLNPLLSARAAIAELRKQAPSKETIYYSYVLDRGGKLIGFLSLRDLILAHENTPVGEVMKTDLVSVYADADQEEAARIIRDYDLLALPVVDPGGHLVGIITHDDAVDIVAEEAQEDFELMAGVTGASESENFLAEPVLQQFRRRAPVICLLALFWLVTATVIQGFEALLHGNILLTATMPMVMAIGGMVGSQASTLVIRALATHEKTAVHAILRKELLVGLALAVILGLVAFGNAALLQAIKGDALQVGATMHLAMVIAVAMAADVVFAALLGAAVPHLVRAFKIDPALISTPAVTALTDLTGAAVFLLMVTLLL